MTRLIGSINFDETTERNYFVKDHLGSVRVTFTDVNNSVLRARDYYPFGEELRFDVANTPDLGRYQFTEKERDQETGLDYFGARYYNSKLALWLSVDPLADKYPGWSPFNYVENNPLKFIDVNGDSLTYAKTKQGQFVMLDTKVAKDFELLMTYAGLKQIPVKINDHFRTTAQQKKIKDKFAKTKPNVAVAAPGTSRHESGFAFDISTIKMTNTQYKDFKGFANKLGFNAEVKGEKWHFQADPKIHGYKSRSAAINENQKDYKRATSYFLKKNIVSPHSEK